MWKQNLEMSRKFPKGGKQGKFTLREQTGRKGPPLSAASEGQPQEAAESRSFALEGEVGTPSGPPPWLGSWFVLSLDEQAAS